MSHVLINLIVNPPARTLYIPPGVTGTGCVPTSIEIEDYFEIVFDFQDKSMISKILVLLVIHIEGTVSVVSSDPPCKDGNARFTNVPLKPSTD